MSVKVKLHPYFQDIAGSQEVIEANGNTVIEIIEDLERQYPGIKEHLLDSKGRIQGFTELFVNSEIVFPENTSMPVNDGDEMEILTIVAGG
jgi:molybdopterin synthase sulfur carrier subunit